MIGQEFMEMSEARLLVDNFELIDSLLNFDIPNSFYFIQILRRRKENPEMKVDGRTINVYYIYSHKDLIKLKPFIIDDCIINNARAYIKLNRLDTYEIGLRTQEIIIDCMLRRRYSSIKSSYTKACGVFNYDSNKKWLLDIDIINKEGVPDLLLIETSKNMIETINKLHKEEKKKKYKIISLIPTKNGYHIITNPFNKNEFCKAHPHINMDRDISDSSTTILYINGNK